MPGSAFGPAGHGLTDTTLGFPEFAFAALAGFFVSLLAFKLLLEAVPSDLPLQCLNGLFDVIVTDADFDSGLRVAHVLYHLPIIVKYRLQPRRL